MGESKKDALRVNFDRKLKVEFHASQSNQRCRLMMQSVCPLTLLCVKLTAFGGTLLDTNYLSVRSTKCEGGTPINTDLYFYISVSSVISVANTNSYTIKLLVEGPKNERQIRQV